jgi:hypothetical protein
MTIQRLACISGLASPVHVEELIEISIEVLVATLIITGQVVAPVKPLWAI